jgi:hypothetical protein
MVSLINLLAENPIQCVPHCPDKHVNNAWLCF